MTRVQRASVVLQVSHIMVFKGFALMNIFNSRLWVYTNPIYPSSPWYNYQVQIHDDSVVSC